MHVCATDILVNCGSFQFRVKKCFRPIDLNLHVATVNWELCRLLQNLKKKKLRQYVSIAPNLSGGLGLYLIKAQQKRWNINLADFSCPWSVWGEKAFRYLQTNLTLQINFKLLNLKHSNLWQRALLTQWLLADWYFHLVEFWSDSKPLSVILLGQCYPPRQWPVSPDLSIIARPSHHCQNSSPSLPDRHIIAGPSQNSSHHCRRQ